MRTLPSVAITKLTVSWELRIAHTEMEDARNLRRIPRSR